MILTHLFQFITPQVSNLKAVWFYLGCQLHLVKQHLHRSCPHILCSTGWLSVQQNSQENLLRSLHVPIWCLTSSFIASRLSFLGTNLVTVHNCWHYSICIAKSVQVYSSSGKSVIIHESSHWCSNDMHRKCTSLPFINYAQEVHILTIY